MSYFGHWEMRDGLPVFLYTTDPRLDAATEWQPFPPDDLVARRHWLLVGNRHLQLYIANDGGIGIFEESHGLHWMTAPDAEPTGISIIDETDGTRWGTGAQYWVEDTPQRVFHPTSYTVATQHRGLHIERSILCPEGSVPWVLIRVRLHAVDAPRVVRHVEQWAIQPQALNMGDMEFIEPVGDLQLQQLDRHGVVTQTVEPSTAPLEIFSEVHLQANETKELWFRFGVLTPYPMVDPPAKFWELNLEMVKQRLPRAAVPDLPHTEYEIAWHGALLTGGACEDIILGGYTLNQSSAYTFIMGMNATARDVLQHALPLIYTEPDLALGALRNTCSWASPEGEIPWALDGKKQPIRDKHQYSDQNLYTLWVATEYAAVTGDLAAFETPVAYHAIYNEPPAILRAHLRRQFRYFANHIGRGVNGHVNILDSDWNGSLVDTVEGLTKAQFVVNGESVLNSAIAAWVLPRFAALCDRIKEDKVATEARQLGEVLRQKVAEAWNGRWFNRAYVGDTVIGGQDKLWLDVQAWAILCGASDEKQSRVLFKTIDEHLRKDSPLGARVCYPYDSNDVQGEGKNGGIWYAVNMTLIWAAAHIDPDLAWDEWQRMSLTQHAKTYPTIWEGTLSGPDAYNAPESTRPGRTWGHEEGGMQAFPVNNLHSHAQPLLAYLRLIGIEPTINGGLKIGKGNWQSRNLMLNVDGHGTLTTRGQVRLETEHGIVEDVKGHLEW